MIKEPIRIRFKSSKEDDVFFLRRLLDETGPDRYTCSWLEWGGEEEVPAQTQTDADATIVFVNTDRDAPQFTLPATDDSVPVFLVLSGEMTDNALHGARAIAAPPLVESELSAPLLDRTIRFGIERVRDRALKQSERRFRTLIENSLDIITVLDEKGVIRFASPSVRDVLGYDSESLVGSAVLDLIHPDDAAGTKQLFADSIAGPDAVVSSEFRLRHADDSWRFLEANGRRTPGESDGVRIVINARDVTARKQAERELKHSRDRLRVVINSAPIMLFAVDRDGRLTLAEGQGLKAVAGLPAWVVGESVFEIFDMSPALLHDIRRALRGETFDSIVKIGESIFECWFSPVAGDSGRTEGMLGVATDISELKRSESQLKRSRSQLRNLARHLQSIREEEQTRIAREIHDVLGQAMTVLKMDVTWLSQRTSDAHLKQKIASMSELIISTIQTIRKIATELRPGILDDLGLAAAIEWQAHEFENRTGIRCIVERIDQEPVIDRDLATSIFRIFQEILTNVARHADADQIDISLRHTGSSILLTVRDDGRGIEQVEISNTKSLGLLGMRERALAWGGTIQFDGMPGKGTTVTVQIPTLLTEEREALQ